MSEPGYIREALVREANVVRVREVAADDGLCTPTVCPFHHRDGYAWCWLDVTIGPDEMGSGKLPNTCKLRAGPALVELADGR